MKTAIAVVILGLAIVGFACAETAPAAAPSTEIKISPEEALNLRDAQVPVMVVGDQIAQVNDQIAQLKERVAQLQQQKSAALQELNRRVDALYAKYKVTRESHNIDDTKWVLSPIPKPAAAAPAAKEVTK